MGRAEEPANLVAPAPDFSFQAAPAPAPGFFFQAAPAPAPRSQKHPAPTGSPALSMGL